MITYKELLTESKDIIVFHGDNFNTTKLDPKLMDNGNNQEGIGIYFSDNIETATKYGKNITYTTINMKNFIDSRKTNSPQLKINKLIKMLSEMKKIDGESLFYFMSNYVEVTEESDIRPYHYSEVAKNLIDEQVRNLQITLSDIIGVEQFVKLWNKIFPSIHGTYQKTSKTETWFAILNTNYKVQVKKEK